MKPESDLKLNELISQVKVMYLAIFANGSFNENQKPALNDAFEAMGLHGDARFMSRKLALRQHAELERDFHHALDEIFYSVSMFCERSDVGHRLLELYMRIVESDGMITEAEETLACELADCLDLDVDYYLDRTI